MTKMVPRSMAPGAPSDSEFPSNYNLQHVVGCKIDLADYTCQCGLTQHLLEIGAFVRYDASMCQVERNKTCVYTPISDVLEEFLAGLSELCATDKIVKIAQEDDK